jgi:hypothetical protein
VNCGSDQQGRSLYSSFIYRLKPGFGRFFRGACNRFWNVLLQKDTQVWENDILMITGLQAHKTTGGALTVYMYSTFYCTHRIEMHNYGGTIGNVKSGRW